MSKDTYRDREGFGRPEHVGEGTWSQVGPDEEDHAIHCTFIARRGIMPCSCDATRRQFGKDQHGERTLWFERWARWQMARSANILREQWPLKWPVKGPDGEPWVPGVDFNDDPRPEHAEWCNWPHEPGTPCRVVRKLRDEPQA